MTRDDDSGNPNRRRLLALLGGLGASAIGGAVTVTAAEPGARAGSVSRLQPDDCPLPQFTDEYVGFSVGQPEGWIVEYSGGMVWLAPADAAGDTLAFVYRRSRPSASGLDPEGEGCKPR